MDIAAVILAAGMGKRMNSELPKVLHTVQGRPMMLRVVDAARATGASRVIVVTGYMAEKVESAVAESESGPGVEFVRQEEQLGTGHAVIQAEGAFVRVRRSGDGTGRGCAGPEGRNAKAVGRLPRAGECGSHRADSEAGRRHGLRQDHS